MPQRVGTEGRHTVSLQESATVIGVPSGPLRSFPLWFSKRELGTEQGLPGLVEGAASGETQPSGGGSGTTRRHVGGPLWGRGQRCGRGSR